MISSSPYYGVREFGYFAGILRESRRQFVHCVLARTGPVAVRLQYLFIFKEHISGSEPSAGWLAHLDSALTARVGQQGMGVVVALVALEALIGIAILPLATRRYAAVAGFVMAVAVYSIRESVRRLLSGKDARA